MTAYLWYLVGFGRLVSEDDYLSDTEAYGCRAWFTLAEFA